MQQGLFDELAVNVGWFDATLAQIGWFDEDLIPDPTTAASGSGVASAVGSATGQGYALHYGYGSASAVGTATGEGLAPSNIPSGSGVAAAIASAMGQGYALAYGYGSSSTIGTATGEGPTPTPVIAEATPGFLRKPYILRSRFEQDEAPSAPVVAPTQPAKPDLEREYVRQSVAIAADVARLRKEADEARAAIAVLERMQSTALAKKVLQDQWAAVARAEAAQAQLFEELEVIDVAYVARAVIGMLH